jgi:hypothetical protein
MQPLVQPLAQFLPACLQSELSLAVYQGGSGSFVLSEDFHLVQLQ